MKKENIKFTFKQIHLSTLLCISLLLFGCDNKSQHSNIIDLAYGLSDTAVIKSLNQLSLVEDPNELNEAQSAKYNLVKVKGELRTSKTCAYDSILKPAIAYYKSVKDTTLLYECLYFLSWGKVIDKEYLASLKIVDENKKLLPFFTKKSHFIYTGYIEITNLLHLNRIQEAEDIANSILKRTLSKEIKPDIVRAWMKLASVNQQNNKPKECKSNYLKALQLAKQIENVYLQNNILKQLRLLMEKSSKYDEALSYAKQIECLQMSRKDIPEKNLVKALLYYKKNELDSAHHYAKIAAQGSDPLISSIATSHISDWYAADGDFFTAYNKHWVAEEVKINTERNFSSRIMQEVYAKKELENENNLLKIKQQQRGFIFTITIFLLLLAIGIGYLLFYKRQRKQHEFYLNSKAMQLEQDNLLLKQAKEISSLREKEALLRESLFRKIDVFKKLPSITPTDKDKKNQPQKITLTEADWNELVRTIDEAHPNFTERLKQTFPSLTMADIYFCCFLKININMQDLSDIYCVSKAAITKKKYRIKTDKLHISDNLVNLDEFLKTF